MYFTTQLKAVGMLPGKELAEKKKLFRSQLSRVRQRARVLEEQVLALTEEKRRGWSSGSPSPSARRSPAAVRVASPVSLDSPVSPRRCAPPSPPAIRRVFSSLLATRADRPSCPHSDDRQTILGLADHVGSQTCFAPAPIRRCGH